MQIEKDSVVLFHYTLTAEGKDITESSKDGDPVACLIGHNNMLPAIENAFLGKQTGDHLTVNLKPEEAYGERREGTLQRVPIKHLLTRGRLKAGQMVKVNTSDGPRDATVIKVGKFNVDIDTNHPLAGYSLKFDISIEDVRPAEKDEVAHGHAHGAGGHHH